MAVMDGRAPNASISLLHCTWLYYCAKRRRNASLALDPPSHPPARPPRGAEGVVVPEAMA